LLKDLDGGYRDGYSTSWGYYCQHGFYGMYGVGTCRDD
jgi:hypothetical protein